MWTAAGPEDRIQLNSVSATLMMESSKADESSYDRDRSLPGGLGHCGPPARTCIAHLEHKDLVVFEKAGAAVGADKARWIGGLLHEAGARANCSAQSSGFAGCATAAPSKWADRAASYASRWSALINKLWLDQVGIGGCPVNGRTTGVCGQYAAGARWLKSRVDPVPIVWAFHYVLACPPGHDP
jgi:hypothetical protein